MSFYLCNCCYTILKEKKRKQDSSQLLALSTIVPSKFVSYAEELACRKVRCKRGIYYGDDETSRDEIVDVFVTSTAEESSSMPLSVLPLRSKSAGESLPPLMAPICIPVWDALSL